MATTDLEERKQETPPESDRDQPGNADTLNEPAVGLPSKNGRLISAVAILVGVVFVVALTLHGKQDESDSAQATSSTSVVVSNVGQSVAQIRTAPVELAALENKVQATGLISYPVDRTVKISPRVTGRIAGVYVNLGDHVRAGQLLAVLDSPDAAAASAAETQNVANLQLAQATLEHTQRQYELGTPEVTSARAVLSEAMANTAFNKDALAKIEEQAKIGGFTQSPLETAKNAVVTDRSSLVQSQADLDTAQRAYDRMVKLVGIGVNSQADLEAATNTLAHAKANVAANQQVVDLAQEALVREQKAFKTNLYADQAVRAQLNNYQQAVLQQAAAQRAFDIATAALKSDLENAQTTYRNAVASEQSSRAAMAVMGVPTSDGVVKITSPQSGVVVERDVNPGQMVDQSQETPWQLFVISDNSTVQIRGDVYENDIAAIRTGQKVEINADAFPTREFWGDVSRIAPSLNQQTRAVSVVAQIPNPGGELKDGMFAEMTIDTGQSAKAPVIEVGSVLHDADTDYVYVAKGGQYVRQDVQIGEQKAGMCVVTSGLIPGQRVVTQGALLLSGQVESD